MPPKKLPNIILFVADEMRGDVISLNGQNNPYIKTPNIDNLAKDGIAFTKCFSVNPVCVPSRCCTFTGQYVHSNAHRSLYQLLRPHEDNLFKFLKMSGYKVIWIGRNDLFSKETIKVSVSKHYSLYKLLLRKFMPEILRLKFFKRLFRISTIRSLFKLIKNRKTILEDYRFLKSPLIKSFLSAQIKLNPFPKGNPLRKSFYFGERDLKQGNDIDTLIIEKVLKFLNSKPKGPFCLYIALNFPHPPYTVEEPFFSMYNRKEIPPPIPPILDDKPEFMKLMFKRYGLEKLSEKDFREIKATYYGMVSRVDYQFGRIIKKLKDINKYEDSAIFFFADHGDYTGDYGITEKWPNAFQDCLINVPLVIKLPNLKIKKTISEELVELIDLFPTILELAKLKTTYTHFGRSLIPLLTGKTESHREAVFAEGGYNIQEPQCFEQPVLSPDMALLGIYYDKTNIPQEFPATVARSIMVRTKEWKLILRNEIKGELYNLKDDPHELNNLIDNDEYKQIKLELKDKLLNWFLNTSDSPHWSKVRNI
ncbi:MAG: sulfatase-like hydrolase/transferase [Candidatus Helarchaeota archaeon]